ncbi:hypothetical protein UPYG_G00119450 [Umbra pygmaea]|uniref:TNFR-Cys domain-containing protein n=1 Tax=Umbra pygmaea TaxID=75934 RepID=A0ABD0XS47_UMBPY
MDCSENQYYLNGDCYPCLQCGPGQEPSEDCGYGSGWSSYCIPCSAKTYKESRNYHNCKFCQSCKRINRNQKSPCTSKSNAVCGDCLPGFYSKTRMDGLQDLECIPCGSSSTTEPDCSRTMAINVEKVWSPETPEQNATVSITLVTIAIFLIIALFIYFRHTLLRKIFKGCLALQSKSQSDMECAASPVNGVTLNLEKQDQDSVSCERSTTTSDRLSRLQSKGLSLGTDLLCPDPGPQLHQDPSYLLETQPLVRYSTCSNCSSGFVSRISSEPPSLSSNISFIAETPVGQVDSGGLVSGSLILPLHSTEGYCASELQETPLHLHVPVECTELDFCSAATSTRDIHHTPDLDCSSISLGITTISKTNNELYRDLSESSELRRVS